MSQSSPAKIKSIGSRIKKFEAQIWQKEAPNILRKGLKAKFEQNPKLLEMLKSTGTKDIVEATHDTFWGSGVSLKDNLTLNSGAWKGQNVVGKTLEDIRGAN